MADVADTVPPAIDQKGNTVIWWVPTLADPKAPKAATELGAATAFRITHSFTPAGWTLAGAQTTTLDERLALMTPLESLDTLTQTFGSGVVYVASTAAGSAAVVLKLDANASSKSGYFVERRAISNGVVAAAAQVGRSVPVNLGPQIPGPIDGTGKFTITQQAALSGAIVDCVFAA